MIKILLTLITITFSITIYAGIENIRPIGKGMHIVLIPGAAASNDVLVLGDVTTLAHRTGHKFYFKEYENILKGLKIPFTRCLLKNDQDSRTLIERSEECVENIYASVKENKISEKKILIIGHSMGGNIARLVATHELVRPYIHSIMSISTPHQGTILADYAYEQYYNGQDFETPFYRLIINTLDLKRPIYQPTAVYGHFGRDIFPWEKTDRKRDLAV